MLFFFSTAPPLTDIYTLSLHDALPICFENQCAVAVTPARRCDFFRRRKQPPAIFSIAQQGRWLLDRKSTRLNSSHLGISYAVFCLKKKKTKNDFLLR